MRILEKLFCGITKTRAENLRYYFETRTPKFNNDMLIIGDDVIPLKDIIDVTVVKDEHVTPYGQIMADFWEVHVITLNGGKTIASFDSAFLNDNLCNDARNARQDAYDLKDTILQEVKLFNDKEHTIEEGRWLS